MSLPRPQPNVRRLCSEPARLVLLSIALGCTIALLATVCLAGW